jgi:hypothetical protein
MRIYNNLLHRVLNYRKTKPKDGITIITGGNLDITKRLVEKLLYQNNSMYNDNKYSNTYKNQEGEILILYKNYNNLKDDFYEVNFINKEENTNKKIQVFNCDLSNQEDKEEFFFFLENNKKQVKKIK